MRLLTSTQPMIFPLIIVFTIGHSFFLGRATDCGGNHVADTIIVDKLGNGAFQTIQAAIDSSIDSSNDQWLKIHINPGTYVEKVIIPLERPCMILEGDDSESTIITYGDHQATNTSATFISFPPNVIVSHITFKNSFNVAKWSRMHINRAGEIKPAVAASIYGDKSFFFNCSFKGYQDTLFDVLGRHYFKDCYIEGEVDFIFGDAQSYYENCLINATQLENKPSGFITAQNRNSTKDPGGFVFAGGSVVGIGEVNLGRAWGPYSRVIFQNTYLSGVVTPEGWNAWNYAGHEENFMYVEFNCTGAGSDTSMRPPWVRTELSQKELNEYSLSSFINQDHWLDKIPTI